MLPVAQALHAPGQEEPDPFGRVRRVGEHQVGAAPGERRQAEPEVPDEAAQADTARRGGLVEVPEHPLVEVDHGDRDLGVDLRDEHRGQVVVAEAEQVGAGEVVRAVQPERPAHRGLRRGRHVVEGGDRPGRAGDQPLSVGDQLGGRREPGRERVGERGTGELRAAEPVPVRRRQLATDAHRAGLVDEVGAQRGEHRLDRTAGQPGGPDQPVEPVRPLGQQGHELPQRPGGGSVPVDLGGEALHATDATVQADTRCLPGTATVIAVLAVMQATPDRTRRTTRLATPVRLRLWTTSVVTIAVLLLAATSFFMSRLHDEIQVIGAEAAPQAATASDLYFALSDLDAQVARLVMIDNADGLSASQLDALRTYQERSRQIDGDIERALSAATTDATRATIRELLAQLGAYRQLAAQAMAVEREAAPQAPGAPLPPAALGYYAHATNMLHFELLPTAKQLRESSQATLDKAYADQRRTALWGTVLTVLLGVALVLVLALLQRRLARHYRRLVNPALLGATLATVGLVVAASFVFLDEADRLHNAQKQYFAPYLALTQAQAVSYDAAADTSRYVLSGGLPYFQGDFRTKSDCLINGGSCGSGADTLGEGLATLLAGPDTSPAQVHDVVERWNTYQRDHDQITTLASSGHPGDAITTLTGIRRGNAAFDFYYYDAGISQVAAGRRQAFDAALRDARDEMFGWTVIPAVMMGTVILLVLVGMRPRLAEYR